jgi:hypothetical protein
LTHSAAISAHKTHVLPYGSRKRKKLNRITQKNPANTNKKEGVRKQWVETWGGGRKMPEKESRGSWKREDLEREEEFFSPDSTLASFSSFFPRRRLRC